MIRGSLGVVACAAGVVASALAWSSPARGVVVLGAETIVNGGAEDGPGVTDLTSSLALPGWDVFAGLTAGVYGSDSLFPSLATPGPTSRGTQFFVGGPISPVSTAEQEVLLDDWLPAVQAGALRVRAGAWLGGMGSDADVMLLSVTYFNASGISIQSTTLQGPSPALRNNISSFQWRETVSVIPTNARRIRVELIAQQLTGPYNNALADGVTCVVSRVCPADFDDGSASGQPDGGVTIDDLVFYLGAFDLGDVLADVDDGTGTGTGDGGVTIDDLLYYLVRFDAGC